MKYKLVSDIEKLWLVRFISWLLTIDNWVLANILYEEYNKDQYSEIANAIDNDEFEEANSLLEQMDNNCTETVRLNTAINFLKDDRPDEKEY